MKPILRLIGLFAIVALFQAAIMTVARAAIPGQIGPYRVELTTEPAVIPIGKVRFTVAVKDSAGKPVDGVRIKSLVQMPGMPMGEKETLAQPVAGKPGLYQTSASFMMEGAYDASLSISGPQGTASGRVPLETGQNTVSYAGGFTLATALPWLILAVLVIFTLVRVRQTGQTVSWKSVASRGTIGGLLLIVAIFGVSLYAITHWRRPGAMTPIEAQAMEMNTPAPSGAAPVTLAEVTRGSVESTVRYTGQAVGFNEQDVSARTQGWLTWMPFYNGQKVTAGEVVARLDTSAVQPQIAQQQAGINMSERGVTVAQKEYRQALAEVSQAHGEQGMLRGAVDEARANVEAAREERANADAMVAASQSKIADAEAQLSAAKADQQYWQQELGRMKTLLDKGAVSTDEFQKERSTAASAVARVQQAQAAVTQTSSESRAAQASVRKADAMLRAAESKVSSVASELQSHAAHVRSAEATAEAAKAKIEQARAGVEQAQAGLAAVSTTRGYSEVRAQISGVVTLRVTSPGQLVNPGQAILRIAQIDPIRLQANVAESDLGLVKLGSRVVIRGQAGASNPVIAKATSITPAVDPTARTGIVEAVVSNRDGRFVPGQFVTMDISTAYAQEAIRVPVEAIRTRAEAGSGILASGTSNQVWVADDSGDGQFIVKPVDVKTGVSDGVHIQVLSGLQPGQKVVTGGGDYLKAGDTVTAANMAAPTARPTATMGVNGATIEVSSRGFMPARLSLKAGVSARLIFIRKDTQNCATEVVLPEYGIKKTLILNQPVVVEFIPRQGEITFTCGMNMLSGKVVAQ